MTINALPSSATTVDPRTAPRRVYRAGHRGRTITVVGPDRVYPSGLRYYRITGSNEYVPAGDLEWVHPARACKPADHIARLARRRFTLVKS